MRQVPAAGHIVISHDFPPMIGGAHGWLYETYRRWPAPVDVLTRAPSQDPASREAENEFDRAMHGSLRIHRVVRAWRDIDLLRADYLRSTFLLLRAIERLSAAGGAALHCLRAFPDGFAGAIRKRMHPARTALVTYAHGEEVLISRTSRQLRWMAARAYAASDLVIVNSESTNRLVQEFYPGTRTLCIHPGVDVRRFEVAGEEAARYRSGWGWPAGTTVVCILARMEPRKNHIALIEAVAQLRADGIPVALVCAGDGEERSRLQRLAAERRLGQAVIFPGAVSEIDKRRMMAAADIFAMPSIQEGSMLEGFGMVFLEAAAAGKPVICGNTGGQAEAVQHMKTGIVVDGRNPEELRAALLRLVRDPALRREMGLHGREWAAQHAWERVVERTVAATPIVASHPG